jgi:hypothetical protein
LTRGLLVSLILMMCLNAAVAHAAPPDPRFGAVEAFFAPYESDDAGVAWERVLFYWREIQPQRDVWRDDYFPPEILQRELSAGREIVGLLINPPGWANSNRGDRGAPDNLDLPPDDPDNHWAQFVHRIVSQYKGVIRHWILWNEPDVWDTAHFGHTWEGTLEEFARLTKVGYLAAKRADSDCVVHLAGLTYWWDVEYGRRPYLERLLEVLAQDPDAAAHGFYFDVASLHIYFKPRTIPEIMAKTRAAMRRYGLNKPIWVDETNAPPRDDPLHPIQFPRFSVTLSEQRNYLIQAFALSLAAGAERVAVYKMSDRPSIEPWEEPFGLVRMDGSERPAYDALRLITTLFADTRSAAWDDRDTHAAVVLDQGEKTTTVLWNWTADSVSARVVASASSGLLVSTDGSSSVVDVVEGRYHIPLPTAECGEVRCDIGGPPLILVEQAPVALRGRFLPPTPTPSASTTLPPPPPTATPSPTPSPKPSPTPAASDTPAASATAARTPVPTRQPTDTSVATATLAPDVTVVDAEGLERSNWMWAAGGGLGLIALLAVAVRRRRAI